MRLTLGLCILAVSVLDIRYGHAGAALHGAAIAAGALLVLSVVVDFLVPACEPAASGQARAAETAGAGPLHPERE